MANEKQDWVWVKLSAKGQQIADGHKLTVAGAVYQFTFEPGVPQKVTRAFDWGAVLQHSHHEGEKLFELCDAPSDDAGSHFSTADEGAKPDAHE